MEEEKKNKKAYHIIPATSTILTLARPTVLKSKPLIERNQVVMGNEHNALCNGSLFDPLDVRPHQCGADLLALMLGKHCERVNGDGAAELVVANRLAILHA